MTDQQRHQAIEKVIISGRAAVSNALNQLQIVDAHLDLIKSLNAADVDGAARRLRVLNPRLGKKNQIKLKL